MERGQCKHVGAALSLGLCSAHCDRSRDSVKRKFQSQPAGSSFDSAAAEIASTLSPSAEVWASTTPLWGCFLSAFEQHELERRGSEPTPPDFGDTSPHTLAFHTQAFAAAAAAAAAAATVGSIAVVEQRCIGCNKLPVVVMTVAVDAFLTLFAQTAVRIQSAMRCTVKAVFDVGCTLPALAAMLLLRRKTAAAAAAAVDSIGSSYRSPRQLVQRALSVPPR